MKHAKIVELIHGFAYSRVDDFGVSLELLRPVIERMVSDNQFLKMIQNRDDMPVLCQDVLWHTSYPMKPFSGQYGAFGVDGSQVYPDRHNGIPCFLLNIGSIFIQYGSLNGQVIRDTDPFLFTTWDTYNDTVHTNEIVDTERFLKELEYGLVQMKIYKKNYPDYPIIMFVDGPLLFWHCIQKPAEFQKKYLSRFIDTMKIFEQEQIPIVGYTSMPRSRELSKIVKKYVEHLAIGGQEMKNLCAKLIDTQLISLFLKPNQRTASFTSNVLLGYGLKCETIDFFYCNIGSEYVRVEMPSWIIKNEEISNFVYETILHQIQNGFGYPTVLSLAHEQAVIRNPDRLFFIKMLNKILSGNKNKDLIVSQKQAKKDFSQ